ncbi:hypothetical protein GCM10007148_02490 [Parvularcula lutaonensis]|nr:hypothetical protein [Parvularcula lutaonensis]GGY37718.1 hypothetical protein GCM10007148_02490 [Parvularcula lutaonensis]
MTTRATPDTITLYVPFRVVKRGGRKEVPLPDGAPLQRRTDNTLVKALARAFRWKRMLESGHFASISELTECEGIAPSYMTRVAPHAARAGYRRDDLGRAAGAGGDAGEVAGAVSGGVGKAALAIFSVTPLQH